MIAKLDDFKKRELEAALNAICLKLVMLRHDIDTIDSMNGIVTRKMHQEIEDLTLFKVQLLNAIGKVGLREEIAQN